MTTLIHPVQPQSSSSTKRIMSGCRAQSMEFMQGLLLPLQSACRLEFVPLGWALPWQVSSAIWPLSRQAEQKPKCGGFFCPAAPCRASTQIPEAYSSDLLAALASAIRRIVNSPGICAKEPKVDQTGGRVGFPDPMGIWCIWPRPQAESVVTPIRQQIQAHSPLGTFL